MENVKWSVVLVFLILAFTTYRQFKPVIHLIGDSTVDNSSGNNNLCSGAFIKKGNFKINGKSCGGTHFKILAKNMYGHRGNNLFVTHIFGKC